MRRSDLEITDFDEIVAVIERCDTMHVGINGDGYPYVVPLSYGYEAKDGHVTLYFHGAGKGLKHELLDRDPRVCVEMSTLLRYVQKGLYLSCEYESAIGYGKARRVTGDEAIHGLKLMVKHCRMGDSEMDNCAPVTTVYAIDLETLTGKHKFVKE